jgi:hypothetical protein
LPDESVLAIPAFVWVTDVIKQRERGPVLFELELGLAAVGEVEDHSQRVPESNTPTCHTPLPEIGVDPMRQSPTRQQAMRLP